MADVKKIQEELAASQEALKAAQDRITQLESDNLSLQETVEKLMETPDDKESETGVGKSFKYGDQEYVVKSASIRIPGIGKQTALEILTNEKAQKWLVEKKSGAIRLKH